MTDALCYAIRTVWRVRRFAFVAITSLAMGIGGATAVFSLVDDVLLKPLPFQDPGKLVLIREVIPAIEGLYPTYPANFQHFKFWKDHSGSFDSMAAVFTFSSATLTGAGEPKKLNEAEVSANLFPLLGVAPRVGRSFLPDEEQPGHNQVVVISDSLWRSRFSASPDLVGNTITLDGLPNTVVGILSPDFHLAKHTELGSITDFGDRTDIFRPLGKVPESWQGYAYVVLARLKPTVSANQALADLNILQNRIDAEHNVARGLRATVTPLQAVMTAPVRRSLWVLFGAVLVLLLVVCANLASLLLARSRAWTREFSIRAALGASHRRLFMHALTETLLVSISGGLLGIAAAAAAIRTFVAWSPIRIPRADEVHMSLPVLLFASSISLGCGLLFGFLPAFHMARVDPLRNLRSGGGSFTEGSRFLRAREWIISLEVAMCAVLLILTGLLGRSLSRIMRVDKGFSVEGAVAVDLSLQTRLMEEVLGRVESIPGVISAAYTSKLPLTGEIAVNHIDLPGSNTAATDPVTRERLLVNVRLISPSYFQTLGIPLIQGRFLEPSDRDRRVAVVSERLAAKLWPGQNPIGKRFATAAGVGEVEVAGISGDVYASSLEGDPTPMVYAPYWKRPNSDGTLVVRTAINPAALMGSIRSSIWSLDPSVPIPPLRTLKEIVSESTSQRRYLLILAAAFAIAALVLALIGIYAILADNVAARRTEICIRIALGAQNWQTRNMIMGRGLQPVFLGLGAGIAIAAAGGRVVGSLLYGLRATDPFTIIAVASVMIASAVVACLIALRAVTDVNPGIGLHDE